MINQTSPIQAGGVPLINIFSFLDAKSLMQAAQVSKAWKKVAENAELWKRFATSRNLPEGQHSKADFLKNRNQEMALLTGASPYLLMEDLQEEGEYNPLTHILKTKDEQFTVSKTVIFQKERDLGESQFLKGHPDRIVSLGYFNGTLFSRCYDTIHIWTKETGIWEIKQSIDLTAIVGVRSVCFCENMIYLKHMNFLDVWEEKNGEWKLERTHVMDNSESKVHVEGDRMWIYDSNKVSIFDKNQIDKPLFVIEKEDDGHTISHLHISKGWLFLFTHNLNLQKVPQQRALKIWKEENGQLINKDILALEYPITLAYYKNGFLFGESLNSQRFVWRQVGKRWAQRIRQSLCPFI